MRNLVTFAIGLVFGIGLLASGMNLPAKVLGFLDLFGRWDPSLMFVMGGAIPFAAIGFALARRRGRSVLGEALSLPENKNVDPRLLAGALIFGVGWGIAGVCPGPAIVNLGFFTAPAIVFFGAMLAGMAVFELYERVIFKA
jgi:uncharacterized membrane protein YedE/YeeE